MNGDKTRRQKTEPMFLCSSEVRLRQGASGTCAVLPFSATCGTATLSIRTVAAATAQPLITAMFMAVPRRRLFSLRACSQDSPWHSRKQLCFGVKGLGTPVFVLTLSKSDPYVPNTKCV